MLSSRATNRAYVGKIASTESRCIRDIEKHRVTKLEHEHRDIARTVYTRALVIYIFFSFVFCFTHLIRYLFHDTRPLLHRADHCFSSLYYYYYHTVCSPHTRHRFPISISITPSRRVPIVIFFAGSPSSYFFTETENEHDAAGYPYYYLRVS